MFSSTLPNGMNDYINAIYAQDWKRGGSNLGTDLVNDESWTDPVTFRLSINHGR